MAKKRVHEIAKEKGIPSKEVIAKLQAAGLNVKAAASSVDEADIELAFSGGKKAPAEDGRGKRPSGTARPGNGKPAASTPPPKPAAPATPPAQASTGQAGSSAARPARPTRDGGGAAAGGRRRRVVIDSQASRRAPGPPPQQQTPPRRRGRRRRTPWVEPDFSQQEEKPQEDVVTEIKWSPSRSV
jgi:translation initiation factor IF-2